jgi:hypothetical protein
MLSVFSRMSDGAYITKGSRVRAQFFRVKQPLASLTGVQMKVTGDFVEVVGTIRHFRGDDPVSPRVVKIYLDPDGEYDGPWVRPDGCTCPDPHVEVDSKHVVGLAPPA